MREEVAVRGDGDFLRRYLTVAPAALAIERSLECAILAGQPMRRPMLDVGCGDGVFAHVLFADRIDTGIDYDPAEIARARAYDRYDELIACSGNAIPKPDALYRTILSNSVLEHIPDLLPVLREQHRVLAPDGRFYVTLPTDRWDRNLLATRTLRGMGLGGAADAVSRRANAFWRHHHAYPEARWAALFADAGFEVAESRTYDPANLTTLLDALALAAAPAMLSKRLLGRWIAAPAVRTAMVPLLHRMLVGTLATLREMEAGSLVFFALVKR